LPQYPELLKTGQVLRDELKQIGIDMTINQFDVSVWYDAFVKGNYQITSAYQERTIDPDNFYSLVLKSGGPINSTGYSNNNVDALIDKAAASDKEAERKDLCRRVRTITTKESPLVFVHYETLHYLMNTQCDGLQHHADTQSAHRKHWFRRVEVAKVWAIPTASSARAGRFRSVQSLGKR
jgi:peptide/nickel transport system substrate-binding protein